MRENIGEFSRFCLEMAEWGFHELTFNQLGGNDRPEFFPTHRLLPDQVRRFRRELPALARRMSDLGLRIRASEEYLERIAATTQGRRIPIDDCQPGEQFLFIDEFSRISPCSFTCGEYGIPLDAIGTAIGLNDLPSHFAELRCHHRPTCCDDCHATFMFNKFGTSKTSSLVHLS